MRRTSGDARTFGSVSEGLCVLGRRRLFPKSPRVALDRLPDRAGGKEAVHLTG